MDCCWRLGHSLQEWPMQFASQSRGSKEPMFFLIISSGSLALTAMDMAGSRDDSSLSIMNRPIFYTLCLEQDSSWQY